jgi:hypothetical protein
VDHPDTGKAASAPQELQAEPPGDQAGQARADHGSHGLRGPHPRKRPGRTAAADHGRGGGGGEKVRGAPRGVATADVVSLGVLHGAMGGQGDPSDGPRASPLAHALGEQARPKRVNVPCESSKGAELAGPWAPHGGADGARARWAPACWTERRAAAAQTKTCLRSRLRMAPGRRRGQGSRVVIVNVYTSWLFKEY